MSWNILNTQKKEEIYYYFLRKYIDGYNIKSQEKINLLMFMDDINIFTYNEKELDTLIEK